MKQPDFSPPDIPFKIPSWVWDSKPVSYEDALKEYQTMQAQSIANNINQQKLDDINRQEEIRKQVGGLAQEGASFDDLVPEVQKMLLKGGEVEDAIKLGGLQQQQEDRKELGKYREKQIEKLQRDLDRPEKTKEPKSYAPIPANIYDPQTGLVESLNKRSSEYQQRIKEGWLPFDRDGVAEAKERIKYEEEKAREANEPGFFDSIKRSLPFLKSETKSPPLESPTKERAASGVAPRVVVIKRRKD